MTLPPPKTQTRRAFLTGVSGGIGGAIAQYLLAEGWTVWGTARSEIGWKSFASHKSFHGLHLDLEQRTESLAAFSTAWQQSEGFDLIINNAGYGIFSPLVEASEEDLDRQVAAMIANTFTLIRVQTAVLLKQGNGTLVNVSSLAVEFPLPFMSGYNMAKAAMSALSESLMMEVAASDVVVIDFRPGDIKTGFNQVMAANAEAVIADSSQADLAAAWRVLEKNIQTAPSAASAARSMLRAVRRGRSGIVRYGGFFQARLAPVLIRLIPERLARAIRWRYFGLKQGG